MPVHPKVKAGTAAAAVSGIVVWLLGRYVLHGQVDAPVTAEIYAAVPAVLTFAAGWLTPAKPAASAEAGKQIVEAIRQYEKRSGSAWRRPDPPAAPPASGS